MLSSSQIGRCAWAQGNLHNHPGPAHSKDTVYKMSHPGQSNQLGAGVRPTASEGRTWGWRWPMGCLPLDPVAAALPVIIGPSLNTLATAQLPAAAAVVAAMFLASSSSFSIYIFICQWPNPPQIVLLWGCDDIVLRLHHILRVPSTSDLCPCHGEADLGWPPWATGCSRG